MSEQSEMVPQILTAPAREKPCEIRTIHVPSPVLTQGHHRHPVFLQNRLYSRIQDNELLWVCGTDHDSIHAWLYWLLKERGRPAVYPGRLVVDEAELTFAWYTAESQKT